MINSVKNAIYCLGVLVGAVHQATIATRELTAICEKIDEMLVYQRINDWQGKWLLR